MCCRCFHQSQRQWEMDTPAFGPCGFLTAGWPAPGGPIPSALESSGGAQDRDWLETAGWLLGLLEELHHFPEGGTGQGASVCLWTPSRLHVGAAVLRPGGKLIETRADPGFWKRPPLVGVCRRILLLQLKSSCLCLFAPPSLSLPPPPSCILANECS